MCLLRNLRSRSRTDRLARPCGFFLVSVFSPAFCVGAASCASCETSARAPEPTGLRVRVGFSLFSVFSPAFCVGAVSCASCETSARAPEATGLRVRVGFSLLSVFSPAFCVGAASCASCETSAGAPESTGLRDVRVRLSLLSVFSPAFCVGAASCASCETSAGAPEATGLRDVRVRLSLLSVRSSVFCAEALRRLGLAGSCSFRKGSGVYSAAKDGRSISLSPLCVCSASLRRKEGRRVEGCRRCVLPLRKPSDDLCGLSSGSFSSEVFEKDLSVLCVCSASLRRKEGRRVEGYRRCVLPLRNPSDDLCGLSSGSLPSEVFEEDLSALCVSSASLRRKGGRRVEGYRRCVLPLRNPSDDLCGLSSGSLPSEVFEEDLSALCVSSASLRRKEGRRVEGYRRCVLPLRNPSDDLCGLSSGSLPSEVFEEDLSALCVSSASLRRKEGRRVEGCRRCVLPLRNPSDDLCGLSSDSSSSEVFEKSVSGSFGRVPSSGSVEPFTTR